VGAPKVVAPGSRLDQKRVGVSVVAARELDDLVAAGERARHARRAHGGFGAELTKRTISIDGISSRTRSPSVCSSAVGAPKLGAALRRRGDRLDLPGGRVAVQERPPRHHVVRRSGCRPRPPAWRRERRETKQRRAAHRLKRADGLLTPPGSTLAARRRTETCSSWSLGMRIGCDGGNGRLARAARAA
jgi:hypothetical protein